MNSLSVSSGSSAAVGYQETCLHLAFTAIARRCPSSPALISDSVTLSYRNLDHEAGRLASLLSDRDAGPGKVVGLLGTPSVESVIGLLAILKTGAAYVPLEPEHPADYQRAVLDRVGAAVLVHESLPGQDRPNFHRQCEPLDTAARRAVSSEQVHANHVGSPDDLCYVMFTSGTTGVPRGVRTSHRACLIRAVSLFPWLPPKDGERACLKASLTVVDSVREIFGSLLAGIPVVVPETGVQRDPLTLASAIHGHHVTRVLLVPSLLRTMLNLEDDEAPRLRGVRCWILSGDTTDPGLVELARNVTPSTAVFNLYGATEAPGTLADLTGWQPGTAIGVGRPLPDVEVLVLGDDGTPVAPGTVGEVHLGGRGLADGYLGAPRETAARFVQVDSRRMFRTGDLGQLDSSGVLRLLGRADRQVKIRGHRIETQDVEYRLRQRPEVQDAAVGLNPARDELVAYLVADPAIDVSKVRRGLLEVLPGHMVPATYLRVTTLPYGNSGKLDQSALDEWPAERLPLSPYVPPRGPVEEQAAAVWRDVLGVERVGRDDGFFDLGGNSLTAAHALARIRQRTGRDVSMRTLFDHSTLRDFVVALGEAHQTAVAPISPSAHGEAMPASPAQRRLWFMEQRVPGTAAYHIASAFRLHGTVDPVAFDAALRVVVNRQEALRTVFEVRSGEPFQRISGSTPPLPLVTRDLTHLAEDEADARWVRTFKDAVSTPFDLECGPLFRFHLFILGERHHVFTLVVHHSVFDDWSEQILLDEISQAYQGILGGTLPIRYRDYARWQHDSLTGDSIKSHVDFWRAALTGAEPVIDLPVDRPWPATPTFSGGSIECALGGALSDGVRQLARERGRTLFSTMLSAFAVTLFQYSGQRDITVGTPSSGRTTEALERIIGFFVNTLPIRIKATDDPSFERLIHRVEEARLDAYDHESLPFDAVVEGLMPDRDPSRNPVFQTWFDLAGAAPPLHIPGVEANRCGRGVDAARFDLELRLTDGPDGIDGALIYNADVLDRETAAGVVGLLHTVTNRLVADPEVRLSQIDPLTSGERRLLVSEWSGARAHTTAPWESLVERFERVAARQPGAIALVFQGRSLTYRQLNEAANRLAHRLHGISGNDADVIGILLPRGLDLVAAILGVFKAGRGYLPLDPTFPPERLAHMLAAASVSLVVVTDPAAGCLAATVEHVPFAFDELAPSPSHNPGIRTGPRDLGYVLYTSGSTGRPKGIGMPQGPLVNLVTWQMSTSRFASRTAQFASFGFDVSFQDTFATLLAGGQLLILDEDERHDPGLLIDALRSFGATRVFVTPMVLREIARAWSAGRPAPRTLREVVCAGEPLQLDATTERFLREAGVVSLFNHYGPTETHVATWHRVYLGDEPLPAEFPIGRPISNALVYVLDGDRRPVPIGVAGELYIGGDVVCDGYVGRPDLTGERFVVDPFVTESGARMYRTGDRVRWHVRGDLRYMGRLDDQVKIRGFRVELGEIAATLAGHSAIADATVLVRASANGDKRLVAYVVGASGTAPMPAELHAYMARLLPGYMIPAAYIMVDEIPLNTNGKVDRRALPESDWDALAAPASGPPVRTPMETLIADVWTTALGVGHIGADVNFFELGGHSMLAVQIVAELRTKLRIDIPLRLMFEHPTITAMAAAIVTGGIRQ